MLKYTWISVTIKTNTQANYMLHTIYSIKPKIAAFDTETNGLHIKLSKPFLFQFGFLDEANQTGYTYAVDIQRQPDLAKQVIQHWHDYAKANIEIYLAHNVKFDLHMLENISLPYTGENLSDTMFYIRYAHDAVTPKHGGPPLGLKPYATRYIDQHAKAHERLLDSEKSAIAKDLNLKLKLRLAACGQPPAKYKARSYTLKVIGDIFKNAIIEVEDLEPKVREAYLNWLNEDVPLYLQPKITGLVESKMIGYDTLNRANLIKYAHYDIIYTLEIYLKTKDVIVARKNEEGLVIENKLIYPLYAMERTGFKADKAYLLQAKANTKAYIKALREEIWALAGTEFNMSQHPLIKQIVKSQFDIELLTTNDEVLEQTHSDLIRENIKPDAARFIEILQELRTLEKWYSVYIMRFLKDLNKTDVLYTTINQVGTVSGRVTSDFQQFPKKPISTRDGVELFHPRKIILITSEEYNGIVYLDYSQIELRFQALYTILVGHPDTNLCRAYMPYKCTNTAGELFDFNNPKHISSWNKEWYYVEEPTKHWEPTDVHGETTKEAFNIAETDEDYEDLRYIGKRVNFAKNYGAQYKKICTMFPTYSAEDCVKIDQAYYKAFPGVKEYHNYCYTRAKAYSNTSNLFNIKYYGVSGHKLINLLVQGSAAYFLKLKIIELYEYMKSNNIKSKFQMQIHDELSWCKHKDETDVFFTFKHIMENWGEGIVPIVADMEATKSCWADKKKVKDLNELQLYTSH